MTNLKPFPFLLQTLLLKHSSIPSSQSLRPALSFATMPKSKYYAVKKGKKTGIYRSWDECKQHTQKYKGAIFKSFKTLSEAQAFMGGAGVGGVGVVGGVASSAGGVGLKGKVTQGKKGATATAGGAKKKEKSVIDPSAIVTAINANTKGTNQNKISITSNNSNNEVIPLKIEMHFDGASKGNPGIAGCGAHIVITTTTETPNNDDNEDGSKHSLSSTKSIYLRHYCNHCTNNIAEYSGLLQGLKQISLIINDYCRHSNTVKKKHPYKTTTGKKSIQVQIRGDSNLIIQQMNGNWSVKNEGMKTKYNECRKIINDIEHNVQESLSNDVTFSISFDHVYRNMNTIADELANEAIYSKKSWITNDYNNNGEEDREEEEV